MNKKQKIGISIYLTAAVVIVLLMIFTYVRSTKRQSKKKYIEVPVSTEVAIDISEDATEVIESITTEGKIEIAPLYPRNTEE